MRSPHGQDGGGIRPVAAREGVDPTNIRHALATAAIAILGVAAYVWAFGDALPQVPVLSWIAHLIRGSSGGGQ